MRNDGSRGALWDRLLSCVIKLYCNETGGGFFLFQSRGETGMKGVHCECQCDPIFFPLVACVRCHYNTFRYLVRH